MSARVVSRTVTLDCSPAAVFELLADPRRHLDIDGSGAVRAVIEAPPRLFEGAVFSMRMKAGASYTTHNTVVEFVEGRRIAWRHKARHIWRWELAAAPGGTVVTETWDWSAKRAPGLVKAIGMPKQVDTAIARSLDNLRSLVLVDA